jgi:hypothetical protein
LLVSLGWNYFRFKGRLMKLRSPIETGDLDSNPKKRSKEEIQKKMMRGKGKSLKRFVIISISLFLLILNL